MVKAVNSDKTDKALAVLREIGFSIRREGVSRTERIGSERSNVHVISASESASKTANPIKYQPLQRIRDKIQVTAKPRTTKTEPKTYFVKPEQGFVPLAAHCDRVEVKLPTIDEGTLAAAREISKILKGKKISSFGEFEKKFQEEFSQKYPEASAVNLNQAIYISCLLANRSKGSKLPTGFLNVTTLLLK